MRDMVLHRPVMPDEVLDGLAIRPDGVYADLTYGRGGHARLILERLSSAGRLFVMDRDPEALSAARALAEADPRVTVLEGAFSGFAGHIEAFGLRGRVDGCLLDIGVSSPQLDDARRGFSFRQDGPLDMRMDPSAGLSAADWLAKAREEEIVRVLFEYGEERYARRIARAIVEARRESPLDTTRRLAEIVARARPGRERGKDPATRTFQAIRIHLNQELDELRACLDALPDVLAPGGRMAVICFHSLEDRIVKRFIRHAMKGPALPAGLPVRDEGWRPRLRAVGRARRPDVAETAANPRARSAVLRVAERPS